MRGRHNLPAPTLGVSTLAARNQPEGMMKEQINMRSDPVRKLARRPSLQFDRQLDSVEWKAYHTFRRGGIVYEVGVTVDDEVKVIRDGVTTTTGSQAATIQEYLAGTSADDIRIHTIADTSFILNTDKVVEAKVDATYTPVEYSYMNVTSALNYGEVVKVRLQWDSTDATIGNTSDAVVPQTNIEFTITIPNADGGDYEVADKTRATRAVAVAIANKINTTNLYVFTPSGATTVNGSFACTASALGSVVSVYTGNLPNMTIQVDGGQGASSIIPITAIKQDTEGMPKYAVANTIIAIQPGLDSDREQGAYYLKATALGTLDPAEVGETMVEVFWEEVADPLADNILDGATMPIVVTQDVVPSVLQGGWEPRQAGDETSNEAPAFVGKTINAMTTFQGRLVFGTGDEVVMSNSDDLYLFFRKSVLQLLATDVVSLGASSTDADELTGFGIYDRDLIVNFPKKQFKVSGSSAVTPQTTAMTPATAYETTSKPAPLELAGSLLLPFSYGVSGGVWDYTQKEQNDQNTATAVTQLVEGYLENDIDIWAASSTLDMAIVKCVGSNVLYVYEQNTNNDKRTQMAWSTWELRLDGDILWIGFTNNTLRVVTLDSGVTVARTINLATKEPTAPNSVFLDDRVQVTIPLGTNTGTLPDDYPEHTDLVYVQSANCLSPYYEAQVTRVGNTITVDTNIHTTQDAVLFVGRPYTSEFTPTRQFIREDGVVVDIDRLSIKNLLLDVVHTNEVTMDTISEYYDTNPVTVLADRVGTMKLGVKSFYSGDFNFPVRKQARWASQRFYTDGYLPLNVIGMTWQGLYKQRMERF